MMRRVSLIWTTVALVVVVSALMVAPASLCPSDLRLINSRNTITASANLEHLAQISASARENNTSHQCGCCSNDGGRRARENATRESDIRAFLLEDYLDLMDSITDGQQYCYDSLLESQPIDIRSFNECSKVVETAKIVSAQVKRIINGLHCGDDCDDSGCDSGCDALSETSTTISLASITNRIARTACLLSSSLYAYKDCIQTAGCIQRQSTRSIDTSEDYMSFEKYDYDSSSHGCTDCWEK